MRLGGGHVARYTKGVGGGKWGLVMTVHMKILKKKNVTTSVLCIDEIKVPRTGTERSHKITR